MGKNGQAWGFDLIVGVMIFLAGMLLFFFYALNSPGEGDGVFEALNYQGKLIGDSLLSEGFPVDWSESEVVNIGIVNAGKVNGTMLKRFSDFVVNDYNRTKLIFRIPGDYYVTFEEPLLVEGAPINNIGRMPVDVENLVRMKRVIVYDNKIKNMNIDVWN